MRHQKTVAVLLAMIMLIAGCGQTSQQAQTSQQPQTSQQSQPAAEEQPQAQPVLITEKDYSDREKQALGSWGRLKASSRRIRRAL